MGGRRHIADFVEKERAAVGLFKFADALICGAGKCPALMAEQFALEKLLGYGGAIDRKKGLLAAVAMMINGAGDEFLAGAAFTGDQGSRIRSSELTD